MWRFSREGWHIEISLMVRMCHQYPGGFLIARKRSHWSWLLIWTTRQMRQLIEIDIV